jgi:hypothetical protein
MRALLVSLAALACVHCSKAPPPSPASDPQATPSAPQSAASAPAPAPVAADAPILIKRVHQLGQRYDVTYRSVLADAVKMTTEIHGTAVVATVTPDGTEFRLHIADITENGRPAVRDHDVTVLVKPRATDVTAGAPGVDPYLTPLEMTMGMELCRPPREAMKAGDTKTTPSGSGGTHTIALQSVKADGGVTFAAFEETFTPVDGGNDIFDAKSKATFRVRVDDGFEGDCQETSTRSIGKDAVVTTHEFHVKRLPDLSK